MKDQNVDIWMEDEVHFQQHGSRCRMWIPPEMNDPVLQHAPTRKSMGYFGAVRLRDGKLYSQKELQSFDGATFFRFLKNLRRISISKKRKVIIVLDNARYHHAKLHAPWREKNRDHFKLLFLPPYSPELNTSERIWKLTRRLCTHNRYFKTLHDLIDSVDAQFAIWSKPNYQLRQLCSFS